MGNEQRIVWSRVGSLVGGPAICGLSLEKMQPHVRPREDDTCDASMMLKMIIS